MYFRDLMKYFCTWSHCPIDRLKIIIEDFKIIKIINEDFIF